MPVAAQAETPTGSRPKLPAGAVWNDDGTVTLTLTEPVRVRMIVDGREKLQEHAQIRMHPLKAAALMDMPNGTNSVQAAFLIQASLRQVGAEGEAFVRDIDAADFGAAAEIASIFTRRGRKTGR